MADMLRVPLTPVEAAAAPARVCVTGAGGYLASHLVQRLLAAGHTVHAAVRSRARVAHLAALPGARERLVFFEGCDLMAPGSFDTAVAGCDYVLHTASPFFLGVTKNVKERLIQPAVEGTKNVLDSVNRAPSVRRVVLTSSIVAMLSYPEPGRVYTEADWNDQASEQQFAYELSKTLAEKAAWEVAHAQDRWSLVAINPGLVMGPPLAPQDGESVHTMKRIMRGDMSLGYPEYRLRLVDVRDVAKAHCVAMVTPSASGRYLLAPHVFTFGRVAEVLREGPLGRRRPLLRVLLPSKPLFVFVLWTIADIINIERYRLLTTYGKDLVTDSSKAEAELGFAPEAGGWLPDTDTYNDMAAALAALRITPWVKPLGGKGAKGAEPHARLGHVAAGAVAPDPMPSSASPTVSASGSGSGSPLGSAPASRPVSPPSTSGPLQSTTQAAARA